MRTSRSGEQVHERAIFFPTPATNAGCPIQAVLWLEWDKRLSTCDFPIATAESKMKRRQKQYRFSDNWRDSEAGTLLRNHFS
jgi:hypothetical protein